MNYPFNIHILLDKDNDGEQLEYQNKDKEKQMATDIGLFSTLPNEIIYKVIYYFSFYIDLFI